MRRLLPPDRRNGLEGHAFEALYRECIADVHAYARSLLGEKAAAEDVTAIAFERLYRARTRFDGTRGTPRSWLFAIARNAALDELRRRRRRIETAPPLDEEPSGIAAPQAEPAQLLEHLARRETVREALVQLAPREREIVLLKFHGQLSNAELARVLGISESNAGTRLHRALERLRQSCEAETHEEVA